MYGGDLTHKKRDGILDSSNAIGNPIAWLYTCFSMLQRSVTSNPICNSFAACTPPYIAIADGVVLSCRSLSRQRKRVFLLVPLLIPLLRSPSRLVVCEYQLLAAHATPW